MESKHKIARHIRRAAFFVVLAGTLVACGGSGGGSGGSPPPAQSPPPAPITGNTGSVSAMFVQGAAARYFLFNTYGTYTGAVASLSQDADGIVTNLNTNTLSGNPYYALEIGGDANFAQGRWASGIVTTGATSVSIDIIRPYHYVVFNNVAAIPAAGTRVCTVGRFTRPTYAVGSPGVSGADYVGDASGNADITFGATGASINVSVNVTAGSSSGADSFNGTISTPAQTVATDNFGFSALRVGALLTLADGGNGAYLVVVAYRVELANGNLYHGIASFVCP